MHASSLNLLGLDLSLSLVRLKRWDNTSSDSLCMIVVVVDLGRVKGDARILQSGVEVAEAAVSGLGHPVVDPPGDVGRLREVSRRHAHLAGEDVAVVLCGGAGLGDALGLASG